MRQDVMEHYGVTKEFRNAGFHESEQHRRILHEVGAAVQHGTFIVLSGIVGCGKTTTLNRLQEQLRGTDKVIVAKSYAVEKGRVSLGTLIQALYCDLSTEKEPKCPKQSEVRERAVCELVRKRKEKPIALFIDEAHDLHHKTLVGLKRLMEMIQDGGSLLSVVLAGHPRLRNDLLRPAMEEIGNRATIFSMDNVHGANREYIYWILQQCAPDTDIAHLFEEDALELLAERLSTPLQIGQYMTLALEAAHRIGGRPVTREVVESVLAADINDLEPRLTRHGYNSRAIASLLNIPSAEATKLLRGQLPHARAQELHPHLLKAEVPL